MIITFFGHSNYVSKPDHEKTVLEYIEKTVGDAPVDFYLGGYGNFDSFALSCAKKYQKSHLNVKIYFITPYISLSYEKNRLKYNANIYDGIIYPPIEAAPLKFAISYRNKWLAEQADLVIAYVTSDCGGAYAALCRARSLNKAITNIAE